MREKITYNKKARYLFNFQQFIKPAPPCRKTIDIRGSLLSFSTIFKLESVSGRTAKTGAEKGYQNLVMLFPPLLGCQKTLHLSQHNFTLRKPSFRGKLGFGILTPAMPLIYKDELKPSLLSPWFSL